MTPSVGFERTEMCDELYVCTGCGELGSIFVIFLGGHVFFAVFTYIIYSNPLLSNII